MGSSAYLARIVMPLLTYITKLPTNLPRYGKRTTANGMQLTTGNASGIMAPFIL